MDGDRHALLLLRRSQPEIRVVLAAQVALLACGTPQTQLRQRPDDTGAEEDRNGALRSQRVAVREWDCRAMVR